MNKLAKKMANREGFTLVELIVVIAILGILAGIAIPVYSGYIAKAKEANDIQQMDAIKTAVIFVKTESIIDSDTTNTGINGIKVETGKIYTSTNGNETTPTWTEITDKDELSAINKLLGKTGDAWTYTFNATDKTTAIWNGSTWKLS